MFLVQTCRSKHTVLSMKYDPIFHSRSLHMDHLQPQKEGKRERAVHNKFPGKIVTDLKVEWCGILQNFQMNIPWRQQDLTKPTSKQSQSNSRIDHIKQFIDCSECSIPNLLNQGYVILNQYLENKDPALAPGSCDHFAKKYVLFKVYSIKFSKN